MYKLIVKRIVRRTFAGLSRGEYEPIVKQFRPQSRFMFAGQHALGTGRDESRRRGRWRPARPCRHARGRLPGPRTAARASLRRLSGGVRRTRRADGPVLRAALWDG